MRFLLVDGHSVIFRVPELRAMHERSTAAAREQLIARLTAHQDASGVRVVVIFDGTGARANEEKRPGAVQILYSAAKGGADKLIERLIAKYAAEHEMMVATDDHLVQQTAISFGGFAMSVEMLVKEIASSDADVARAIKKLRRR
jgi:uncharacterized protein